jgi:hypothetical protein
MRLLAYILFVCFGFACGLSLAVILQARLGTVQFLPAIQTIGSVATAFGATIAFVVYLTTVLRHRRDDQREESETYMQEALALLDKAYETFTRLGEDPPANDRLLWLSTARMIVRFQKLRKSVVDEDHRAVVEESEEYFRLKFYTLLNQNGSNFTSDYFRGGATHRYAAENIARRSIAIIFQFSRWKAGATDPLDSIDDVELFAKGALPIDQTGAEEYLEGFADYWQKVQDRKRALDAQ